MSIFVLAYVNTQVSSPWATATRPHHLVKSGLTFPVGDQSMVPFVCRG